jgi:hypothetical protein
MAAVAFSLALAVPALTAGPARAAGSPAPGPASLAALAKAAPATAATGTVSLPRGATPCPSTATKKSSPTSACGISKHGFAGKAKLSVKRPAGSAPCPAVPGKRASSATAACSAPGTGGQRPSVIVGGGGGYSVTLSASSSYVSAGTTVTLTATSSVDVGPTAYFIEILHSNGSSVAICGSGTTCSTTVNSSGGSTQNFIAYISSYGTADPPPSIQATSNGAAVSWVTISLTEIGSPSYTGEQVGLTASTSLNVGPTPYWITIFDATTGTMVAYCGTGTTCYAYPSQSSDTTHAYVAYVSALTNPPSSIVATSATVRVTWAHYEPGGGWFAGFVTGVPPNGAPFQTDTDPVNVVLYNPGGGATAIFRNAMAAAGGWHNNTCYNQNVVFYTGHDLNANNWIYSAPAGSYATNVTASNSDPPGYSGCGLPAPAERDHLRYWVSSDDTTVWIAVSDEVRGCPNFLWWAGHCVASNGYNRGRQDLINGNTGANTPFNGLLTGLAKTGYPYSTSTPSGEYAGGSISSNGIGYDGTVDIVRPVADLYQISGNHAAWVSDSYNSAPLTSITLAPGGVSSNIYITFNNQGPGTWDSSTVLASWSDYNDGQPSDGTSWCHAPGGVDWLTCNPGIPAWIGSGTVAPGASRTFEFQIQANASPGTYTLYFRPAQRLSNGTYAWMNTSSGNRTYDYFTVVVT